MADPTPPRDGLNPVVDEINSLKKRASVLEGPSGTQRARAVRDLVGRVSYSEFSQNTWNSWISTQPTNAPWGNALVFTLTEDRRVSIEYALGAYARAATYGAGSTSQTSLGAGLSVNGVPLLGNTYLEGFVGAYATQPSGVTFAQANYSSATLRARAVIDLPAGEHSVRGLLTSRSVSITGAGDGFVGAQDSQLFVDVLQTLGG